MSFTQILEELPNLSSGERLLLIERASELESLDLSTAEEDVVDTRLTEHDRTPSGGQHSEYDRIIAGRRK